LTTEERLNINVDSMATEKLRQLISAERTREEWHLQNCLGQGQTSSQVWKFTQPDGNSLSSIFKSTIAKRFDLSIQDLHHTNWAALR
jgi:hypothetical protein